MLELDPASLPCDRVTTWIFVWACVAAGLVTAPLLALLHAVPWLLAAWLLVGWLVLCALLLWGGLRLSELEHRHTRYLLDDTGLILHRGFLWRRRTIVPRSRVQHTDVSQGPVQRRFGLATLTVHTAGSENASVSLPGLRHEEALRLRDALVASAAARPALRTGA